jgi:3'(2'), 5'-bisphosphate nucleotidase
MISLPPALLESPLRARVEHAIAAVHSAGAGLLALRGSTDGGREVEGGQLKTSIDLAAEGWVLGYLRAQYEAELFLAEEQFEQALAPWPGARAYWTVDALDGTRSFVEGYPGFCVQVAYIEDGAPVLGVIAEPVAGHVFVGARGAGAWRLSGHRADRLSGSSLARVSPGLRVVDSTTPGGALGALMARASGRFVECGSVGLKICRVVEDAADLYAKRFNFKLWDVAPGEVLLREVGARLGLGTGAAIDYAGTRTHYTSLLAAPAGIYDELVGSGELSEYL